MQQHLRSYTSTCYDSLLQGNIAWDDEYCYIDDKFREKVTESPGFQWVDEAKPHHLTKKEGFVATKPGAHLLLTVNTAETTQPDVRFQLAGLLLVRTSARHLAES